MTDFEQCKHDLDKWHIPYNDGYLWDDYDCYKTGYYIEVCGSDEQYLEFSINGKFKAGLY